MNNHDQQYGMYSEPYSLGKRNVQNGKHASQSRHHPTLPALPSSEFEDPGSVQLPQSDFESYYTDLANYESEFEQTLFSVQDLAVPIAAHPVRHATIPATDPGPFAPAPRLSQYVMGLPSDPPELPDISETAENAPGGHFDNLPSSPPSSPQRLMPHRSIPSMSRTGLDSLGIMHPSGYHARGISSIIPSDPSNGSSFARPPPPTAEVIRSPYAQPPIPQQQPLSPYSRGNLRQVQQQRTPQLGDTIALPMPRAPNSMHLLSPALSDTSSISPDPNSPHLDSFSWQPILTAPRSEHSEAIIEEQRRPKQKRRSCLPDGVVDEYVGTTDTEGVYICLYPNCQRLFKRTYNLRSHIQTHLCDRPYICKSCEANFVRPHDLRRHERCHSDSKPFVCPCGKGFNRQDAMQRHRMREICEGAIPSGTPRSPKPRGRPKGRKNSPQSSPELDETKPEPFHNGFTDGHGFSMTAPVTVGSENDHLSGGP